MARTAVEALLQASMGLDAASIGSATIARAVRDRLSACGLSDVDAYLERVRSSGAELQALIEAVVVPETWFFRDRHALTTVGRLARDEWLPARAQDALALLSLPCSTGEEPYSMAMALFDAGVPASRFHIDAVDISARSLARAQRGVYGKNSFRGHELGFRDRYFELTSEGYRVIEAVRQQVRFRHGNLLAAGFLPGAAIYDAIFCRNVLIYFDGPTQDLALLVLNRLLRSDGVLFVAPAETALPARHQLVSTHEALAFAFRKKGPERSAPKHTAARRVAPVMRHPPAAPATNAVAIHPLAPSIVPVPDIADALRLADLGRFAEAATSCEEFMRRAGPSAPAFYLMGLVRDATGSHVEAAMYYRKALYLEPNHYDTQIQLALLLERQGDVSGAQVMRNRARRLELTKQVSHE